MIDVSDFFCEKCGRLKRRCICGKRERREKNLRILKKVSGEESELLKPFLSIDDEVVHYRVFEPLNAQPDIELNSLNISEELKNALKNRGISRLYEFQKIAIHSLLSGENTVITAPTGFGKTEAFVIPMIELVRKGGKGIVIYPTKALAADQELKIKFYCDSCNLIATRFDGDSSKKERDAVLSGVSDIVLTNPDMLDYHLRNTPDFRSFITELSFLAVDELHYYTGFLGANLHYLVKRMRRYADFQIACASATISNAKEFACSLFDANFRWINASHRKSKSHVIMIYCDSLYSSVVELLKKVTDHNKKILIFGNSYKSVEYIGWILNRAGIRTYIHKSGLKKAVRNKVEEDIRKGRVKVVVSTSTLELGVDIGDVDAVISELVSYPQFVQRLGRAGRKGQSSVGVLLMRNEDTIANYYRNHPEEFFESDFHGFVETENELVMRYHLISMCAETPLKTDGLGDFEKRVLRKCVEEGYILTDGEWFYPSRMGLRLLENFNLRGTGETIRMYKDREFIGERALPMALKEMHPGAVLIHNGERLRSIELDVERRKAFLEPFFENFSTYPLYSSIPVIVEVIEEKSNPVNSAYCNLEITMSVYGYMEKDGEKKRARDLDEPISWSFRTKGFLLSAPFPEPMDYDDFFPGSFHAFEHVLIETGDVVTGGSTQMGGISTPDGDIFVYDATPGGSGLSKLLFERIGKVLDISLDVLKNCKCGRVDGCPACTYSYQCGNNNSPLNRLGAIDIIERIKMGKRKRVRPERYREIAEFRFFP
jgi:DEAD/DEAH box helicase domain-containing protein